MVALELVGHPRCLGEPGQSTEPTSTCEQRIPRFRRQHGERRVRSSRGRGGSGLEYFSERFLLCVEFRAGCALSFGLRVAARYGGPMSAIDTTLAFCPGRGSGRSRNSGALPIRSIAHASQLKAGLCRHICRGGRDLVLEGRRDPVQFDQQRTKFKQRAP